METSLTVLVALCVAEFVHNILEIWGMRQKVQWLELSLDGKPHGRWPININTKLKTVILHALVLSLSASLAFLTLRSLNLDLGKLVEIGIGVLLLNYAYTTWRVDSYHSEIGRLIARAKRVNKL